MGFCKVQRTLLKADCQKSASKPRCAALKCQKNTSKPRCAALKGQKKHFQNALCRLKVPKKQLSKHALPPCHRATLCTTPSGSGTQARSTNFRGQGQAWGAALPGGGTNLPCREFPIKACWQAAKAKSRVKKVPGSLRR